ncbi:hypothetical protein C3L33_15718, partial [Rhododendron williamsianum]
MAAVVEPKKIIIDADPGIDDAMAILVALRSPEVEVIGLTTIYGNVYTTLATRNALHLKGTKLRIADFVHGADGLGNQNFPPPVGKPVEQSAAAFLVEQATLYPGKVTVVALGPLTNIALAIQLDPAFTKNIGQIVVLGGAFAVNGNVNPAAEANVIVRMSCVSLLSMSYVSQSSARVSGVYSVIGSSAIHKCSFLFSRSKSSSYAVIVVTLKFDVLNVLGAPGLDQIFGDPDAADIVFTSGADVLAVGINVTHQVVMTGNTLCHLHVYITEYYYICAIYVYIIFLRINYL